MDIDEKVALVIDSFQKNTALQTLEHAGLFLKLVSAKKNHIVEKAKDHISGFREYTESKKI